MAENAPVLPFLSPVGGKPVDVAFDGGRLTSDAGVLVLAEIERKLGIAERLARGIEDPRDPQRVTHQLAEMIRFRALLVAAGYPDGNDCDVLRTDPAFKLAVGRLPETGAELCSQPTISRLENLPSATALKRMMAALSALLTSLRGIRPPGDPASGGSGRRPDGRAVLRQLHPSPAPHRAGHRAGVPTNSVRGVGTTARIAFTASSSSPCSTPITTAAASCRSLSMR